MTPDGVAENLIAVELDFLRRNLDIARSSSKLVFSLSGAVRARPGPRDRPHNN
ncbi:hypothetical protein ABZ297_43655 [Nonomuraea sp. NPDC005983]|uniref:hypothetical protein n=1 Tax=Nonomuraea sp. NPDC005983 TaxID=3155595 RepID=UPI0033A96A65